MSDKRERLKKNLGISEYPWSSDDDDVVNLGMFQQSSGAAAPNPTPDISVIPTSQPSSSSAPNAAVPGTSGYNHSSSRQQRSSNVSHAERQLFWSMLCNNKATVDLTSRPRSDARRSPPQSAVTSARPRASPPLRRTSPLREIRGMLAIRRSARVPHRSHYSFGPVVQVPRGSGRGMRNNPLFTPAPAGAAAPPGAGPAVRMVMRAGLANRDYVDATNALEARIRAGMRARAALPPTPPPAPAPATAPAVAAAAAYDTHMDSDGVDTDMTLPSADTSGESSNITTEMRLEEEVLEAEPAEETQPGPCPEAQDTTQVLAIPAARSDSDDESHSSKKRDSGNSAKDDNVKELNQSLLRLLECPVCLEWMEPPMSQCRRGHLVCVACRARLSSCPVCRTAFSSVRNRAMEGVAEMLRYPCRHGCGHAARLRRRAAHEASCARRRHACPAPACARRQPISRDDMQRHVQAKHPEMLKLGRKHKFSVRVNAETHENYLVVAMHEIFHVRIDVEIRSWGVTVYAAYMGPKVNAKKYQYEVTIEGKYNSRKLVYSRGMHSDLESSSVNMSRQDCFHLSLDQALNFMRQKNPHSESDNLVNLNVEISACKNEEPRGEESCDS